MNYITHLDRFIELFYRGTGNRADNPFFAAAADMMVNAEYDV